MSQEITYSQAFQAGMREEMQRDDRIFVLGTDLFVRGGHWAQVKGLGEEFGRERIRDTPISEAAICAAGVGAALQGMRPMVDLNFIDFVFGGMDEVVNQAAKSRYMWGVSVPLVIRATMGVAYGGSQHNNQIESWFAHTPGLLVALPSTPADVKGLIKSSLRCDDPVVFLMHKLLTGVRGEVGGPDDLVPMGQAIIRRRGRHVSVAAYSIVVNRVLDAAELLAQDGIDTEVIDMRMLYPLDLHTVEESVRKTGRLIVASEAPVLGSVASSIAAQVQMAVFDYLDAPVVALGATHAPIPHSPPLFEHLLPQTETIAHAIRQLVEYEVGISPAPSSQPSAP